MDKIGEFVNKFILKEIKFNLHQIFTRIKIILIICARIINKKHRKQLGSYHEYDEYWTKFWNSRDIFRTDLSFTYNDAQVSNISPFDYKKKTILTILSDIIDKYEIKTVLEIGSGAGLNLVYLASKHKNVKFVGVEPTSSGINITRQFIADPPKELLFEETKCAINNLEVVRASVLNKKEMAFAESGQFDLVFSNAVLEQLHNEIDVAFENIFTINSKYFLLNEEWLDCNTDVDNYKVLVANDYFRIPWSYINKYKRLACIEIIYPLLQPSWLKYSALFIKKNTN